MRRARASRRRSTRALRRETRRSQAPAAGRSPSAPGRAGTTRSSRLAGDPLDQLGKLEPRAGGFLLTTQRPPDVARPAPARPGCRRWRARPNGLSIREVVEGEEDEAVLDRRDLLPVSGSEPSTDRAGGSSAPADRRDSVSRGEDARSVAVSGASRLPAAVAVAVARGCLGVAAVGAHPVTDDGFVTANDRPHVTRGRVAHDGSGRSFWSGELLHPVRLTRARACSRNRAPSRATRAASGRARSSAAGSRCAPRTRARLRRTRSPRGAA